jgi:hypothetical protein
MTSANGWQSEQVIAWTDREGPGRPPAGSQQKLLGAVALVLGAAFVGMLSSDTLCPEHRAWVDALATTALVGVVVSIVALVRQWSVAPLLTLISGALGVAIGLIDAAHAPARGQLIAGAFGLVVLAVSVVSVRLARLAWWERKVLRDLAPAATMEQVPAEQAHGDVADKADRQAPQPRVKQ